MTKEEAGAFIAEMALELKSIAASAGLQTEAHLLEVISVSIRSEMTHRSEEDDDTPVKKPS